MRDFQQRMGKRKDPGKSGFRFRLQCGQFFIKTVRQVFLDLANSPVNLVVIVEQPFGGFPCICWSICAGFSCQRQPIDGFIYMTPGWNGLGNAIR